MMLNMKIPLLSILLLVLVFLSPVSADQCFTDYECEGQVCDGSSFPLIPGLCVDVGQEVCDRFGIAIGECTEKTSNPTELLCCRGSAEGRTAVYTAQKGINLCDNYEAGSCELFCKPNQIRVSGSDLCDAETSKKACCLGGRDSGLKSCRQQLTDLKIFKIGDSIHDYYCTDAECPTGKIVASDTNDCCGNKCLGKGGCFSDADCPNDWIGNSYNCILNRCEMSDDPDDKNIVESFLDKTAKDIGKGVGRFGSFATNIFSAGFLEALGEYSSGLYWIAVVTLVILGVIAFLIVFSPLFKLIVTILGKVL